MISTQPAKVSKAFSGTYEQMVAKVLQDPDYLDSRKTLFYQKTRNQDKIVVPNFRPFGAIELMQQRALADDSKSAGYYFYQTTKGFHFRSFESMCVDVRGNPRTPKQTFKYMPMNVDGFCVSKSLQFSREVISVSAGNCCL